MYEDIDFEKLFLGLKKCPSADCYVCPFRPELNCSRKLMSQAKRYMEKQIPLYPKLCSEIEEVINNNTFTYRKYVCPKCNSTILSTEKYCPNCGQRIMWEENERDKELRKLLE